VTSRAARAFWYRTGIAAMAALWLGCWSAAPASAQGSSRSAAELMDAVMWNREPIGGAFQLIDQSGQARSERDYRGQLLLVYFGFTYCPDICPTDLQAIGLAMDRLGADAAHVQPLFITLDPERDTREQLAQYVPMFHPKLIGLTGSTTAIHAAAEAYRVYYKRVDFHDKPGDYTVDHSAFVYLMDRDGKYLGFFPPGTSAEKMVDMIRPYLGIGK
jgi:cytochrome oxidase Cu insertion factor (SCO1/SenC/PrrC family)